MNFDGLINLSISRFRYVLLSIAVVIFFITLSSFHQTTEKIDSNNIRIAHCLTQWYELFLKLESKDLNAYPPISAERLAKMGIAGHLIYEQFKHSNSKSEEQILLTLNEVYSRLLSDFFKGIKNNDIFISELNEKIGVQHLSSLSTTKNVNEKVESILLALESFSGYVISSSNKGIETTKFTEINKYSFSNKKPILPKWGQKPTYYIDQNQIKLKPPFSSNNSFDHAIQHDALSVFTQSIHMSDEDKWVAEFWSDDVRGLTFSPAGRWISITNQLVQHENLDKEALFNLYLRLGIGLHDGAIVCWKYKYYYNLQRPSDYINQYIDSKWQPFHEDPNFPSYPSGHSVFGAIAATILENTFGENYAFTDNSHQNRLEFFSNQRKFINIKAAAIENAYSRFLLGVHFKEDCEEGLRLGYEVGHSINKATNIELLRKVKPNELN